MLLSEETAPSVRPWMLAGAAPDTMLCNVELVAAEGMFSTMMTNTIQLWGARPKAQKATAEVASPITASFWGEMRFNTCLSKTPCISTLTAPTAMSDKPVSCGPQPNLKVVKRTQVECSMNCARLLKPMTATKGPTPRRSNSPRKADTGLALRQSNAVHPCLGRLSGKTK